MNNYFQWKIRKLIYFWKTNGAGSMIRMIIIAIQSKFIHLVKRLINPMSFKKRESEYQELYNNIAVSEKLFRVTLLVSTFFDVNGENYFQGGAERYIIELNQIIKEMGGDLEVYQCGVGNWYRIIHEINVFGLDTGGINLGELNLVFHRWVTPGDITIYFQMLLSAPLCNHPSICISHGIDWDAHWLQANSSQYNNTVKQVLKSLNNVSKIVSVDTITINWVRATNAKLAEKCQYIPNFVDTNEFSINSKTNDNFIILYPRRLSEARGFWLLSKNIPPLLQKYPEIQFHFCGKAEPFEENEVKRISNEFPNKIKWFDMPPNRMVEVYQSADIVVIPTCYSEGTSLSLLEAMASKKPVIATTVGGLTDLILPGFNGIQIEPNAEELFNAICLLIENPNLCEFISTNAFNIGQVFDKSIWAKKWREIIISFLPDSRRGEYKS